MKTGSEAYLPQRVNVLGVDINSIDMMEAVKRIADFVDNRHKAYICVTGVHGIMECQHDRSLGAIHNRSGLTVPDGMPVVWAAKLLGFKQISRVYGPDLMLEVCKVSIDKGYTHFLYGGGYGTVEVLRDNLEMRFPGLNIVGTMTPPFRPLHPEEESQLIERVAILKPDFFWVGLSTPKQERFIAEYITKLDTTVMLGVGAAFDIHSGKTNDAPGWMKHIGMQWFHRLCQEPKRLWRRYLYNNPAFLYRFAKQLISGNNRKGDRLR